MFRKLMLATIVLAAACGESPTEPALSGIYDMVAVEGVSLPAAIPGGIDGVPATVTGGSVALGSDHTVSADLHVTLQSGSSASETVFTLSGTYSIGSDTVYMHDATTGQVVPAVISGSRLTARLEGLAFAFDRRPAWR
jgi:hypothetical protein